MKNFASFFPHIFIAFNLQAVIALCLCNFFAFLAFGLKGTLLESYVVFDHFVNIISTLSLCILVPLLIALFVSVSPLWALVKIFFFREMVENTLLEGSKGRMSEFLKKVKSGEISKKRVLFYSFGLDVLGVILMFLLILLHFSYSPLNSLVLAVFLYIFSGCGLFGCYVLSFPGLLKNSLAS